VDRLDHFGDEHQSRHLAAMAARFSALRDDQVDACPHLFDGVLLGADGAWTGSVWLTTEEAETAPHTVQKFLAATSRDTIRSTGRTGKPARQLVSDWTNAWQPNAGGHETLPLPLQSMLAEPVIRRVDALATQGHPGAQALATYFVGQGVGLMNKVKPARDVVLEFIEDYLAATERLSNSLPD
ncbi:MAG: hypothetical protein QOF88_3656, partial [Mycobacterium sp.]|nr:hypothetical protein [Mycobacterium sp.]